MNSPHRPFGSATAIVALALLAGCATRGYPTHGGGKRFSHEQDVVARSIDRAIARLDLTRLLDLADAKSRSERKIPVQIYPMAHSGGGVQTGSTGLFGSLFGVAPVLGAAEQGMAAPAVSGPQAAFGAYSAYGFETADDLRYLMGRLVARLGDAGLQCIAPKEGETRSVLCLLVSELGIDQSDFSALVYTEKQLVARTRIEAFLVGPDPEAANKIDVKCVPLGIGASAWRFREDYFLGFGPISGGVAEELDESGAPVAAAARAAEGER